MSIFISNMADEFLKNWHGQGDSLKENLNQLLQIGDDCINMWVSPIENKHKYNCLSFEKKLLKCFEAIDENFLNMQKCIINVLRYLSYTRQQLEERIEFKNTHSRCQWQISELQQENSLLKGKLENEEKKCQTMLQKIQNAKKSQRNQEGVVHWCKQRDIQNLNREIGKVSLENQYLKQNINKLTHEYNSENKRLQKHLKEYEETFEKMRLNAQLLQQKENVEDISVVEDNLGNDIKILEKTIAHFVDTFKKSLIENQQLRSKINKCNKDNKCSK